MGLMNLKSMCPVKGAPVELEINLAWGGGHRFLVNLGWVCNLKTSGCCQIPYAGGGSGALMSLRVEVLASRGAGREVWSHSVAWVGRVMWGGVGRCVGGGGDGVSALRNCMEIHPTAVVIPRAEGVPGACGALR